MSVIFSRQDRSHQRHSKPQGRQPQNCQSSAQRSLPLIACLLETGASYDHKTMVAAALFPAPSVSLAPVRQQTVSIPATRALSLITPAAASTRKTLISHRCARSIAAATGGLAEEAGGRGEYETTDEIKAALYTALDGIDRGIFGAASAKKSEIEGLVELLEFKNPTPQPTDKLLDTVDGCWRLVYSTISILGAKRTKLGLRDLVNLGDFFQIIDATNERATNVIKFNVRGLKMLSGQLTIEASFKVTSKTRVEIKLESSNITPSQLMNLFQKNYDILLAIFNPEGWLEITYVDDSVRIGRDDKGNIFVLERSEQEIA